MVNRGRKAIEDRFAKDGKKAAFIAFAMAGDPTLEESYEIILELSQYADIIEVGIPYSDPLADGPVIQGASLRALRAGTTMDHAMTMMRRLREHTDVPLIAFTYVNPVIQYGIERMVKALLEAGVDGMIVPDLPYEESGPLREALHQAGLAFIPLIALTSQDRIHTIAASATGFAYCVSSLGVTGERSKFSNQLEEFVSKVKEYSPVPVAVGFGVREAAQVDFLKTFADGVIVGSAIVRYVESIYKAHQQGNIEAAQKARQNLMDFAKSLAFATGRKGDKDE